MKLTKQNETILTVAAVVVVFILLNKGGKFFEGLFSGIGDIFGGGKVAEQAKSAVSGLETAAPIQNPFSPQYLANLQASGVKGIHYIKGAAKKDFANKIHKAAGPFSGGLITGALTGSRPEDILDVFNQISYQSQVSDLATYFKATYKKDLLRYMVDGLKSNQPLTQKGDNEIVIAITKRVQALPAY
jgi:hypothetical protein